MTGTLKAIELMRKDEGGKGGTVINVSSIAALHQAHYIPIYFATKSAVMQFSNCIGVSIVYLLVTHKSKTLDATSLSYDFVEN